MGYDAYGAVVEWEPMPGTKGHWNSLWYYGDCLRPRLTAETRALTDTVLGTLTTGYVYTEEWARRGSPAALGRPDPSR